METNPRKEIEKILIGVGSRPNLTEYESKSILSIYGLPVTRYRLIRTKEAALEAAREIGYPIVMKLVSPDIVHKTETGVVKLNLRKDSDVATAYEELTRAHDPKTVSSDAGVHGILVENMVTEGVEVIIGMKRDEVFGPTILFGLGGILVEVLKEVSLRVAPLTMDDAFEMIKETKGYELLIGHRGARKADVESLVHIILEIARFSECFENVLELDLNPILVKESGKGATIVDARMTVSKTALRA